MRTPTGEESWENNQPNHHRRDGGPPKARPNRPNHTEDPMDKYDPHCKQPQCKCNHLDCYRGWIDTPIVSTNQTTEPCPTCRPDLTRRLAKRERARAGGYPIEALYRIIDDRDHTAA